MEKNRAIFLTHFFRISVHAREEERINGSTKMSVYRDVHFLQSVYILRILGKKSKSVKITQNIQKLLN